MKKTQHEKRHLFFASILSAVIGAGLMYTYLNSSTDEVYRATKFCPKQPISDAQCAAQLSKFRNERNDLKLELEELKLKYALDKEGVFVRFGGDIRKYLSDDLFVSLARMKGWGDTFFHKNKLYFSNGDSLRILDLQSTETEDIPLPKAAGSYNHGADMHLEAGRLFFVLGIHGQESCSKCSLYEFNFDEKNFNHLSDFEFDHDTTLSTLRISSYDPGTNKLFIYRGFADAGARWSSESSLNVSTGELAEVSNESCGFNELFEECVWPELEPVPESQTFNCGETTVTVSGGQSTFLGCLE